MIQDEIQDIFLSCPTSHYLFIAQPNLHMTHLSSSTAAPNLRSALQNDKITSRIQVTEMVGSLDLPSTEDFVRRSCAAVGKKVSFDTMVLASLPASGTDEAKRNALRESDEEMAIVYTQYEAAGDYTVIYTGKETQEPKSYEAEFKDTTRQELKRQLGQVNQRANETDKRPLFEKYQFFTPGKFHIRVAGGCIVVLRSS
jgi:hypothetical protein